MIFEIAFVLSWAYIGYLWDRIAYQKSLVQAQKKRILELQGLSAEIKEKNVWVDLNGSLN